MEQWEQESPVEVYTILRVTPGPVCWERIPVLALAETLWLPDGGVRAWGQLCHDGSALYVHLWAAEKDIRATYTVPLSPVHEDSCLEFFLAPDAASTAYVNREVNPLCVMHIGVGAGRHGRTVLREIPQGFNPTHSDHNGGWWAIAYTIPAAFLKERFGVTLKKGQAMRGNFYKCGDATAHPHWGMWTPYSLPQPDFHRPELFPPLPL